MIEARHTVTISKSQRSGHQISRTWNIVDGIHEDYLVDNKEIGVGVFDSSEKENSIECVSLLKFSIHFWPGNWWQQPNQTNKRTRLQNNIKLSNCMIKSFLLFNRFIKMMYYRFVIHCLLCTHLMKVRYTDEGENLHKPVSENESKKKVL